MSDAPTTTDAGAAPITLFTPACGPVRGRVDGDGDAEVVRASGIPYASADRFEVPRPLPAWSSIFEADTAAPACPQHPVPVLEKWLGYRTSDIRADEDCLRLSVTMPRRTSAESTSAQGAAAALPVMVWLHGGSYVSGAGDLAFMDPAALVAEQNVIVVTVTYRLGVFGYAGETGAEAAAAAPTRPANLGLLDQLAALDWVQRNIEAFGGDAGNVTLFGESAGGDAVLHLLATPGIGSRVRRAVVQSAPIGILTGKRSRMHDAMSAALTTAMARDLRDRGEPLSTDEVLAFEATATAAAAGYGLSSLMPFGPQTGHEPLPHHDDIPRAWDAAAPGLDVMIGANAQEVRFFMDEIPVMVKLGRVPVVGARVQSALSWVLTGLIYAWPARRVARRMRRAGARVRTFTVTWAAPGNRLGAAHTIELPLLFGNEEAWRDAELVSGASWQQITAHGRLVREVWGRFARGDELPPRLTIRKTLRSRAL